ncbi:MAG: ferritin-like domain-containing protein [Nocardioidaceae bacterium]
MSFSVEEYAHTASPVRWDDIDLSTFADQPLSAGTLRVLRYMCDIESHTVCYLRDLLVTPSHADPEVTTFLTMWNYEEYWHGEVLADVLAAHGIATDADHIRSLRLRQGWKDKLAPVRQALLANIIGDDFIATHMTWGAINEWLTHAGYMRLIEIERHPTLTEILSRIAKQETRHIAFYATQARTRLARSPRARRITRFALSTAWRPVGSGVMPADEVRHLLRHLMGDAGQGTARRIDAKIDTLPGLEGLGLVRRRTMIAV